MRTVTASLNSVQVQHLYEKNPALSEVERYVFDSLLKHHLISLTLFFDKIMRQGYV